jgi:hypothetical protein
MGMSQTRVVVLIGAGLYVSAMAFSGGVAAERIRFDRQRAKVLQRYDEAVKQWHQLPESQRAPERAGVTHARRSSLS